jgi:OOP family OmpA-OmpF porin
MDKRASFPLLTLSAGMMFFSAEAYSAAPNARDAVYSKGSVVVDSANKCVRTKWNEGSDICAPKVVQMAPAPLTHTEIAKEARTIYFAFNKSVLTTEAQQKLDTLANVLKSQQDVRQANIVGFADRIGSQSYNETLSKKRATVVRNYIVSRGYANANVAETRWFGETVPVTSCAADLKRPELIQCLQQDRRVEVELDYIQEKTGAQ